MSLRENDVWELPPECRDQWTKLVATFGLIEGSKDEPFGSGILQLPTTISDEQKEVLIETLGLLREVLPVPPGSYTPKTLPPQSYPVFVMLAGVYENAYQRGGEPQGYGFTENVRSALNKVAGRFPEPQPGLSGQRVHLVTGPIVGGIRDTGPILPGLKFSSQKKDRDPT